MKVKIIFLWFLIISSVLAEGNYDREISQNRNNLEKVKNEINLLKKQIAKANIQSSSNLEQIKYIDQELSLLGKAKKLLKNEGNLLQRKVDFTRSDLDSRQFRLKKLKHNYALWVVDTYKYGRIRDISLLLNARSLNQAMIRAKYLQFFTEQEERLIGNINNEIAKISHLNNELTVDLKALNSSINEKEKEALNYLAKKDQKKVLVSRLKWTSQSLSKKLKNKEDEYQKLYQIIVALERKRKTREKQGDTSPQYTLDSKDFQKNKGKLPWPIKGKIIHKYGKQRNAQLKTTINNTGIDIRARQGGKVSAVFTGIVTMITYLSGFGNTIILNHGDGYYSVYSHLDEVLVELDDLIGTAEVIGVAGDSGSLEGTKLHFALFADQRTENPQKWLRN
jgi:septal ring factor EnvC (AmiA/AmiB activator)